MSLQRVVENYGFAGVSTTVHSTDDEDCPVCTAFRNVCLSSDGDSIYDDDPACPLTPIRRWIRALSLGFLAQDASSPKHPYHDVHKLIRDAWPALSNLGKDWFLWSSRREDYIEGVSPFIRTVTVGQLGSAIQSAEQSAEFVLFTKAGMAQVPAIPHTSIPDAPATSDCLEAWNFVRNRRRKCQEHHKVCTAIQSARKPWTPPRLLQLLPDGLRLVETSDLGDICPYVALSYCWGLGESLCTTSESIDDFKRGIPSRDLPSGIKDAVAFTREMSLTWLWIDRFCILQDSQNDWAMNSALMASIYGQADVVVSAVAPSSVFEPFLGDFARGGRIVTPSIAISLNSHADADVLHLRMRCHPWSIIPTKYTRALDTRGWTFQERFLATRCVRYEQHQITWECATEFISIIDPPLRHEPIWKWRRSDAVSAEQWLDIVNEYSSRHLTYAADRLPAISGVAAKFYEVLRCRYFAGLWESSLLHGLQWCSLGFPGSKAMISLILSSPMATVPEAPSWSWASCQTGAMYFTKSRPVEDIAKILHVSCEPSTNNPFGSVKPGATLTIEAPCENTELKLIISSGENDSDTPLKWALTSYESDPSYSAIISMDDPLELHPDASAPQEDIKAFTHFTSMTSWQRAQFKRLVTLKEGMKAEVKLLYTSRKVGDFTALVLTQDPEDPSFYRRIGVVKWLGEWEKRRDRKTAVIETLKIK